MGVLNGKVAIITAGRGPGMGQAISKLLAKEGASVVIADISLKYAEKTAAEIQQSGGAAIAVPTDVSKSDDVERMVETAVREFGKVSILINHAGAGVGAPIEQMTEEMWDRITGVHLKGTYLCTRAVVTYMKKERWGRIVSTASRAGYRPSKGVYGLTAYSASKYALVGFSRALAMELGPWDITVNCIAPGLVDGSGMDRDPEVDKMSTEQLLAASQNEGQLLHPQRYVTPQEIAGTWLYLVGPHASRVTGVTMHVNGGSYFGG
jgi:3-oxoacyl-[acyl-carrier protein] reductase